MTDDFNARLEAYLATAREDFIRANAGEVVDLVVANKPVADKPIQTNFLSDGAAKQLEKWANRNAVIRNSQPSASATFYTICHKSGCSLYGQMVSTQHECDNEFKSVTHYNDIGDRNRVRPYRYNDLRKRWRNTCLAMAFIFIVAMMVTSTPVLIIPALLLAVIS